MSFSGDFEIFSHGWPPPPIVSSFKVLFFNYLIIGTALGAYQYTQSKELFWAVGAGLLFLNIPFTLTLIAGINQELSATSPEAAGAETRKKIVKWGNLHSVRTVLSAASVAAFVYAFVRQ
jgi:uncharacterized membrane protein